MNKKKVLTIALPIVLFLGVAAGVSVMLCFKSIKTTEIKKREVNLFEDGQIDFKQNGKWGMRTKDKVVIKPQYDSIGNKDFYETVFGVYTENLDFRKYYKKIRYRFGEGDNLGYLDKDGKIVIDAKYGGTICLDGMIQAYKAESDWRECEGVIDENDNVIIDFKYEYVGYDNISNIYWCSKFDKKKEQSIYSYFDEKGKELTITKDYECCSEAINGLVVIRDKNTNMEGLMTTDGKMLCKPKYGEIMLDKVSQNMIPFKDKLEDILSFDESDKEAKVGFLNAKGKVVIEPQYNDDFGIDTTKLNDRFYFSNDRAIVHPKDDYDENDKDYSHPENNLGLTQNIGDGVIDKEGNYIIQPKYEKIIRLKNGNFYFEAASDGNTVDSYGFFTKDGKLIRENNIHEDDYNLTDKIDNNRQIVSKTSESDDAEKSVTKYGLIDEKGKLVTDIIYDSIGPAVDGDDEDQNFIHRDIVVAKKDGKYGYINSRTGKEISDFKYLGASRFYDDGYAIVFNESEKAEIIDTNFKTILKADGFNGRTINYYKNK